MLGLGLMALWGARHGRFAPAARATSRWSPVRTGVSAGAVTSCARPSDTQGAPRRWLTRRRSRWSSARSPERTWDVLTDFDDYPTWANDLKSAEVVARDDEGRAARGRLPGRRHGPQHQLHAALRLQPGARRAGLEAGAGRHHPQARRVLRARPGRRRRRQHRWSPTTSRSTCSCPCRASSSAGPRPHRPPRCRRLRSHLGGRDRAAGAPAGGRGTSCCSRARAGWARPRRRRPRPCAAPTPGCARWPCRPTRPTRWATPSTPRSARWWPRWRRTSGPSSSTPRTAWRTPGPRSSATSSRSSAGPGSRGSRPRSCRSSPGSTRSSPSATSSTTPASGEWDVVVVDCAPTAETIRLLSLPDVLGRYMERLFPGGPPGQPGGGADRGRVTSLPVAGDEVFAATERFYDRLDGVRGDPHRRPAHQRAPGGEPRADGHRRGPAHPHLPVAVRLPRRRGGGEPPAARRGRRPVVRRWKAAHAEHLAAIEEGFAPVPGGGAAAAGRAGGPRGAASFADALYGDEDPTARLRDR